MSENLKWGSKQPLIETAGFVHQAGVHVTKAVWCGAQCGFALGDGRLVFASLDGVSHEVQIHAGGCLAAAALNHTIISAGDDGHIVATQPNGEHQTVFQEAGRFFDQLATADWGGIAFADGRRVFVFQPDAAIKQYKTPSAAGGLSFSPKGRKLAVSHKNGASIYWLGIERDTPDDYVWEGAHGLIDWSPRGDFLVTSMHENALHVWRIDRKKHGRMGGYPTRIKSISWDGKGNALATGGADGIIIWPFRGKDGPIGQIAEQIPLKPREIITALAWHPKDDMIAAGTDKGSLLLARRDGATLPLTQPLGHSVTTLAWSQDAKALAFGSDQGALGLVRF